MEAALTREAEGPKKLEPRYACCKHCRTSDHLAWRIIETMDRGHIYPCTMIESIGLELVSTCVSVPYYVEVV